MNNWKYKNNYLEILPSDCFGFIYKIWLIKDLPKEGYKKGCIYIGKKQQFSSRKTKITKKEKLETGNNRKKFKKVTTEMDWQNYWSSSEEIKRLISIYGNSIFKREIIEFCDTKYKLTFCEVKQMILHKIYEIPTFNKTLGRFYLINLK